MLAIFLVAFYRPRVGGRAVLGAALVSEAAVLYCKFFSDMAWLWWNVVGCVVGVVVALVLQMFLSDRRPLAA